MTVLRAEVDTHQLRDGSREVLLSVYADNVIVFSATITDNFPPDEQLALAARIATTINEG